MTPTGVTKVYLDSSIFLRNSKFNSYATIYRKSPTFGHRILFSVLKAQLQRNYVWTRASFEGFGDFLCPTNLNLRVIT